MDAKVILDFTCRLQGVVYAPGDVYSGTPERIAELAEGGYVEAEAAKESEREPAKEPEKPATEKPKAPVRKRTTARKAAPKAQPKE